MTGRSAAPGDSLMVHGGCRSVGCYAMTNEQIEEIYGLAHEAFAGGQTEIPLEAFPFRMTEANLDRHRDDPNAEFWAMLKSGSDAFAATARPPQVAVCDHRYVFAPDGARRRPPAPARGLVTAVVARTAASNDARGAPQTETGGPKTARR